MICPQVALGLVGRTAARRSLRIVRSAGVDELHDGDVEALLEHLARLDRAHLASDVRGVGGAKSARDNITPDQLADLKEAASELLALSNGEIAQRLDARTLEEADYDENP